MFEALKWAIVRRSKQLIREELYRMIEKGVPLINERLKEARGVPLNIEEKKMKRMLKDIIDEELEEL